MQRFGYPPTNTDNDLIELTRRFEANALTDTKPTDAANLGHQPTLLGTISTKLDPDTLLIMKELERERTHKNKHTEKARRLALDETYFSTRFEQDSEDDELDEQDISEDCGSDEQDGGSEDYGSDEQDDRMMEDAQCDETECESPSKQIMLATPMYTLPPNFINEWVVVPCPKGTRCLVTSGNGQTVARSIDGRTLRRFQSCLPYGSIYPFAVWSFSYCILDCIYKDGIYNVLDVMCWNGRSLYELSTDDRHLYMLEAMKYLEDNHCYPYPPKMFRLLPHMNLHHPCLLYSQLQDTDYFGSLPSDLVVGALCYHRAKQYVAGKTSLVRWMPFE